MLITEFGFSGSFLKLNFSHHEIPKAFQTNLLERSVVKCVSFLFIFSYLLKFRNKIFFRLYTGGYCVAVSSRVRWVTVVNSINVVAILSNHLPNLASILQFWLQTNYLNLEKWLLLFDWQTSNPISKLTNWQIGTFDCADPTKKRQWYKDLSGITNLDFFHATMILVSNSGNNFYNEI